MLFIYWSILLLSFLVMFMFLFLNFIMYNYVVIIEYYLFSFLSFDLKLYLLLDWVSLLFLNVVLLISSMLVFYSYDYMYMEKNKYMYFMLMLMFVFSMIMLILCPNLFMILLGWDGLGLVSYCLVIYYQNYESNNAGLVTILSNRVGDVMMFLSIVFFISLSNLDLIFVNEFYMLVGFMLILAGMTKSAQIPFSAWLPMAMAAPTPVSSLVHSSTLVAAGVYLLIRLNMLFSINLYTNFLLYISLVTLFMSGIGAMVEMDLKSVVALSTLSQLSLMLLVLSVNLWELSYFHLLTHALFKATLFMCVGYILHDLSGIQDIRLMSLFYKKNPLVGVVYSISIITLFGMPFLSGYYSKDLILEYIYMNGNLFMFLLMVLSVSSTCLYSMRMLYYSFFLGELKTTMCGFHQYKFMEYSIYFMGFIIMLFGSSMSWLMLHPLYFYVMFKMSIINILLIFGSLFCMFLYSIDKYNMGMWKLNFFSNMWFLSNITMYMSNFIKIGVNFSILETSWVELVGPQGLYKLNNMMSNMFLWFNLTNLYNMIMFFIIMLTLF
uniref:NADH:ubiquinone reductase (H(+)-translocating) n=1 Tax=Chiropterargas boueti TaxID=1827022 RepID=A0A1P8AG30_9ACAR|nr:NADH dehydrogenase subunit 5 [Chiropterargas boueti]AMX74073.1 NADH dehydrogenase subunit 5 [Chiropterargas boueti]AMX74086.1 NADH dehydrogenase subunit 5 [Chiropterargas boueti]